MLFGGSSVTAVTVCAVRRLSGLNRCAPTRIASASRAAVIRSVETDRTGQSAPTYAGDRWREHADTHGVNDPKIGIYDNTSLAVRWLD